MRLYGVVLVRKARGQMYLYYTDIRLARPRKTTRHARKDCWQYGRVSNHNIPSANL